MRRTFTCLAAVAMVAAGSAAAFATPLTAGPQWVIQPTPNRAVQNNDLEGVSCTSGAACTAVGLSGVPILSPVRGTSRPLAAKAPSIATLAERWDGTHWRIEATPNPVRSSFNTLNAVACTSRRACIAVGSGEAGSASVPLAERWNGSRWSIEPTPRPPRAEHSELVGLACPTSNECIAVGDYGTTSRASSGFAERWNGSRWTLAGLVRPGASSFLAAVSCSSPRSCTAVGAYAIKKSKVAPDSPLAERWSAGRWSKQPTPGPGVLDGVSCPTSSQCFAVGSQPNPSVGPTDTTVLAMRWRGGKWRKQATPVLSGSTLAYLRGVSCPTVTSCTAAGWIELSAPATTVTVVANWNSMAGWTVLLTPNPAKSIGSSFNGIWCGAHIACRAAGTYALPPFTAKSLVERG